MSDTDTEIEKPLPPRPRKPLVCLVSTFDKSKSELIETSGYYSIVSADDYKKLYNHIIWATNNGKSVEICNAEDESFFM